MLAAGLAEDQILVEYPDLEAADIRECLRYAAANGFLQPRKGVGRCSSIGGCRGVPPFQG
jgi:uncharacterized protein (DUF433 family)